jgi:hypothetical protein
MLYYTISHTHTHALCTPGILHHYFTHTHTHASLHTRYSTPLFHTHTHACIASHQVFYSEAFDSLASDDSEDGLMKIDKADFRWLSRLLLPADDAAEKDIILRDALSTIMCQRIEEAGGSVEEQEKGKALVLDSFDNEQEDDDDEAVLVGGLKGVILSGYLHKMGHNNYNWKRRWFVLTKESVRYFTKDGGKLLAEMAFSEFRCSETSVVDKPGPPNISGGSGLTQFVLEESPAINKDTGYKENGDPCAEILLMAAPAEDRKAWIAAMNGAILRAANKQAEVEALNFKPKKHPEYFFVDFIRFCERLDDHVHSRAKVLDVGDVGDVGGVGGVGGVGDPSNPLDPLGPPDGGADASAAAAASPWTHAGRKGAEGDTTNAAAHAAPVEAGDVLALQEEGAGAIEMTEVIEKKGKKKKRGKSTRSEVSKKMITRNVRTVV